MFKELCWNYV